MLVLEVTPSNWLGLGLACLVVIALLALSPPWKR